VTGVTHATGEASRPHRAIRAARAAVLVVMAALVAALLPAGLAIVTAGEAKAASPSPGETYRVPGSGSFKLSGLGFGHGIGMSQFGAEGMGQLGKNYRQIVKFYFPGTNIAQTAPTHQITVGLSGVVRGTPQGGAVEVIDRPGLAASNRGEAIGLPRRAGGKAVSSFRVVRGRGGLAVYAVSGADVVRIAKGLSGAVTWRTAGSVDNSRVAVATAAGGKRLYRGFMEVKKGSSSVLAISRLRLEDYLRSVVSHEVPASWTASALRAQAVAARSYALTAQATARATHRPYDICDTTYCQAYGPIGIESGAEARAVRATRGVYLKSAGQPVLAMFSSANGGYTVAGSRPYLVAKPDPYDGVVTGSANWGHSWDTTIRARAVENAWPQIGRLQKLKVLGRDGNGQWGGRVMSVGLLGSKGKVTVSADSFRWAVGLKSTWWTVTNADGSVEAPAKNVRVERGDRSAVVRWGAPDTRRSVTGYRVSVSSTDDVYRVGRATRKLRLTQLTNGKEYRAQVVPLYRSGRGPKTTTPAFVPTSSFSYYQSLSPRRLVDRVDVDPLDRGGQVSVDVLGAGRAPEAGTRAVVVRVSAEAASKAGRLFVWPCGVRDRQRHGQVAVAYSASGGATGLATVPVRGSGRSSSRVCLGAGTALASLDVDLLGYYTSSGVGTKSLRAVAARRVVNSTTGKGWSTGRLVTGEPRSVAIAGRGGVPDSVRTVVLSLGLVRPTESATLSISGPGSPVSLGAVVRAPSGGWRTGAIVARLDANGRLPLRLTAGRADVHVEILGWFRAQQGERSGRFRTSRSLEVLDAGAPLAKEQSRTVRVRGGDTGVPGAASAVVVQVLARSDDRGYLTVAPAGSHQQQRPVLAFAPRGTQRTVLVVPVGDDGKVTLTSRGGQSMVSMCVVGWFS
jgi:stage II sporulation protein D